MIASGIEIKTLWIDYKPKEVMKNNIILKLVTVYLLMFSLQVSANTLISCTTSSDLLDFVDTEINLESAQIRVGLMSGESVVYQVLSADLGDLSGRPFIGRSETSQDYGELSTHSVLLTYDQASKTAKLAINGNVYRLDRCGVRTLN